MDPIIIIIIELLGRKAEEGTPYAD